MDPSRESPRPSFAGFLTRELDSPWNELATQASSPYSGKAAGRPSGNFPRVIAQESTSGPTATGQWPQANDSDPGSTSVSSLSISPRRSSYSSENSTSGFLSIAPSTGSVEINTGRPRRLPCLFPHCSVSFDINSTSREGWYSHNLTHFEGCSPPAFSLCIFCSKDFSHKDPWVSWRKRMQHIGDHFENGKTIEESRPDFGFFGYLREAGLLSDVDYQHITIYTERPYVEGLMPHDWIPPEIVEKNRSDCNRQNRVIVDPRWEDRHRKGLARRKDIRMKQDSVVITRKRYSSTIGIQPDPQPKRVSHLVLEPPSFATKFDPSSIAVAKLDKLTAQETTGISNGANEADRYISDPRSLLENLYDSDSDESLSSQDIRIEGCAQTSQNGGTTRYSETCLQPDYDADEDLMDPRHYKQKLEDIQDRIFKDSVAMLLGSYSKSSARIHIPHVQNDLLPVLGYSEMLERIEKNICTLQKAGFCQGKLSFLILDPIRTDVASLISVPVDSFLNLRPTNAAGGVESPEAAQLQQSASLKPKLSSERIGVSEGTKKRHIIDTGLRTSTYSLIQSDDITPSASRLMLPKSSLTIPKISSSIDSRTTRSGSRHSQDEYSDFESTSSRSASIEEREFRVRQEILRVPDPCPGRHGITAYHRGNVTVFNHQKRNEGIDEPRSSASHSSDFHKSISFKKVTAREKEGICPRFKASNHGSMWAMLVEDCIRLLQTLRMKLSAEDPMHIVYTTLQVLDLIILSYSRGHISPSEEITNRTNSLRNFFRISGTQIYSSSNPCQPYKGAITLARRKLKCLDGFLDNHEVWVFHGEQSDPRREQPLYLSTSPEDFADIWGPMWKMTDPSNARRILRYDLEHGSIIPLDRSQESSGLKANLAIDEELCHWVSNNELRRKGDLTDATIISKSRLLIGAKRRMKLEENHDCHCDASCITRDLRNSCLLQQVGTNKPRRRVDAEAVNGALGGGITGLQVTYSMVTKIEPGRTFKESLLKRWSHDQQRRNPYILIKRAAVEMSFCTHNSRRIRLVDLFGTKTILRLVDAIDPIKDQECNSAVKEILKSDPVKLVDLYVEKPEWREEIAGLVSSCLETLCDTGIKQETAQPISLFWMYRHEEYILMLPRSSHRWSGFIQDSLQSCAFVVFEEKCLIMETGRGCQHASKGGKSRAPKEFDSLFESALVINERMSQPSGLKLLKKGKTKDSTCWDVSKLERGSTFKMGDSGGIEVIMPLSRTRLLVKWFPKNSFKAGFHEFLSRIVEKEPELHHMEYDGEIITGDPLPISVFVVA